MYNTTQTPPDYSTPTKGGNGDCGATKEKNQYLLLTAPRNQRFLAQLGLNEEVSSK